MGLVEEFVARYAKEYDYYDQAARRVAQALERDLQAAGVRCIVTSRAKAVARLAEKCKQRQSEKAYASVEDIYSDIADLAGVRVALYFPAERAQVDSLVKRLFHQLRDVKVFPDAWEVQPDKRFSGYSATHYRVRLKEAELPEIDRRYATAAVEIQVASVLMHAWAEVEHDLVYKPLAGDLSEDEHAILDQLNGLVMAGEIALERLQKAGERRVAARGRRFSNHFELAAHLLDRAAPLLIAPVGSSEMGRVDWLFGLAVKCAVDTPDGLAPYLESLHSNLELRPLAEQIIDALLAEDPDRYDIYREVRSEGRQHSAASHDEVGFFLQEWVKLEMLLRSFDSDTGRRGTPGQLISKLVGLGILNPDQRFELEQLRRLRNHVVHGIETLEPLDLHEAALRVRAIGAALRNGTVTKSA